MKNKVLIWFYQVHITIYCFSSLTKTGRQNHHCHLEKTKIQILVTTSSKNPTLRASMLKQKPSHVPFGKKPNMKKN
jgi:hypothetical protein